MALANPLAVDRPPRRRYRLEQVHRGGDCVVHKCRDLASGRYLGVKRPRRADPGGLARLSEEHRLLRRVGPRYAPRVYGYRSPGARLEDPNAYLIYEWLDHSLAELLDGELGAAPLSERVALLKRLLSALRGVHLAGLVHRDLKPGNVLLSADRARVVIADFGIASSVGGEPPTARLSHQYAAPEAYRPDTLIEARQDLYALGLIAYELLLGRERFRAEFCAIYASSSEVDRQRKWLGFHIDPQRLARPLHQVDPDIPPPLSAVVARLMAKDPERRFADCDAVLAALAVAGDTAAAYRSEEPDLAAAEDLGFARRAGRWLKSLRGLFGLGALAVVCVLFALLSPGEDRASLVRSAEQASGRMQAARAEARRLGAEAGIKSFADGVRLADSGGSHYRAERYRQAVSVYAEAERRFALAAQIRRDQIARHWDQRLGDLRRDAERARGLAQDNGAGKRESFVQGQGLFERALAQLGRSQYRHSERAFSTAAQRFLEAAAGQARERMNGWRGKAERLGLGDGMAALEQGRRLAAAAESAYRRRSYRSAVEDFNQAAGLFEKVLSEGVYAPLKITLGSDRQQQHEALRLCRQFRRDDQPSCSPDWFASETARELSIKPFRIDPTEVTVGAFAAFVAATGYRTEAERSGLSYYWDGRRPLPLGGFDWRSPQGPNRPQAAEDFPVSHVNRADAEAYCRWRGARLPSEDEWEYAARGRHGRLYPWGETWDDSRVIRAEGGALRPVGRNSHNATPSGLLDMAGNVWEWTATGGVAGHAVLKGGSSLEPNPAKLRAAARLMVLAERPFADFGFRCAQSLPRWQLVY